MFALKIEESVFDDFVLCVYICNIYVILSDRCHQRAYAPFGTVSVQGAWIVRMKIFRKKQQQQQQQNLQNRHWQHSRRENCVVFVWNYATVAGTHCRPWANVGRYYGHACASITATTCPHITLRFVSSENSFNRRWTSCIPWRISCVSCIPFKINSCYRV